MRKDTRKMRASTRVTSVALLGIALVFGAASARTHPSNCVADCSHQYNASMRAESGLHVTNVQACGSNQVCKAAENTRHGQAVKSIQHGRDLCQDQCPGGPR